MSRQEHDHDLLARMLRERSEDMSGSHLGLDDVRGRAHRIRRRRRAVAGAAAAVVLAVGVPAGLTLTDLAGPSEPLPTSPSPGPTVVESGRPEPTPTEPPPTGPIPADGAVAPRGEDPAIAYVTGSVVHPPGQAPVDLGRRFHEVTPYAGGWAGIDLSGETTSFVGPDGTVDLSFSGASLAVSADGQTMASVLNATGGLDIGLRPSAGEGPDGYLSSVVALEGTAVLAGFLGPEKVAYNLITPRGETRPETTDFATENVPLEGLLEVSSTNEATGVVSGLTEIRELEPGSCSAVLEVDSQTRLWETCDFTLESFSPDGRYVIGTDSYHDGIGGSTVAILDASDGRVLAHFTTRDLGFTGPSAWESDSTVLVSTYQDGAWYLLRLRPDGTVEQALDPVTDGDEMQRPWNLAVTP